MQFYLQSAEEPTLYALESSEVKITANKYRIIGQSSLKAGENIDIRLVYHHPSYQQVSDYATQVNTEGSFVLMPLTSLRPGQWEIYCRCDLIAEMVGEYWETRLLLDVEPEIAPPPPKDPVNLYLQQLEQVIKQEIEPVLQKNEVILPLTPEILPKTVQEIEAIEEEEIPLEGLDYLNYTLELADTDTNISYTFDIAIEKAPSASPIAVHLPEPRKSSPSLRPVHSSSPTLPPKLFPSRLGKSSRRSLELPHVPRPEETFAALNLKEKFSSRLNALAKSLK